MKVFMNLYNHELHDEDNVLIKPDEDFIEFLKDAPMVDIPPEQVMDIKENDFEIMKEELDAQIRMLEDNNVLLRERIEEQEVQFREQMDRYFQEQERLKREFRDANDAFDRKISEMRRQNEELSRQGRKRGGLLGKIIDFLGNL